MQSNYELTILMPCLNEEETIGICIQKAQRSIEQNNLFAEILVADNGSSDMSVEVALKMGARVIHVKDKGYGNVLNAGIHEAYGKYVIMGDSDDSYDFEDIYKFVVELRKGNQLVMGNRFKGGVEKGAMPFLHKYLGNPVLSFIGRVFFENNIKDFHCGLRGFDRQDILELGLCTTGMEFASEMVVKASLNNYKTSEVPIKLYPDGRTRKPHLRTWHDGWRHLRFLLLYSPKWLFLIPGIFLLILGILLTVRLSWGPIHLGNVELDIHTMLYASMLVVLGFQISAFYIQSKIIGEKLKLFSNSNSLYWIKRHLTLEKGLISGFLLVILGAVLTAYNFLLWKQNSFGDLVPQENLRTIIPSVTAIIIGFQIAFNSFFISFLNLNTNNNKEKNKQYKPQGAAVKEASIV